MILRSFLVAGVALVSIYSIPARAEVNLGLGGYFIGYGLYASQDDTGTDLQNFGLRKQTKIAFEGETELENGLKAGFASEIFADRAGEDEFWDVSYAILSGNFGQINLGEGDGAAAILQVEAPAADPFIDGIDPQINALDVSEMGAGVDVPDVLGYLQEPAGTANKIAYISPVWAGLQLGASYAPSVDDADLGAGAAAPVDNDSGEVHHGVDLAARYEREVGDVKFTLGGGMSRAPTESADPDPTADGSDDRLAYNAGVQIEYAQWILGTAYVTDNNAIEENGDTDITVLGLNYALTDATTLGVSYYDRTDEANFAGAAVDTDIQRWAAGAAYKVADGVNLRGSLSYLDVEGATDGQGTQVALGTEISF